MSIRNARIEAIKAELKDRQDHPFASYCGEADALQDELDSLAKPSNVDQVIELYSDDPLVSSYWYGKMIEEAAALDDLEEDRMTAAEFDSLIGGE